MEVWKDVIFRGKNYGEFYKISSEGRLYGVRTGKIRKLYINKKGYYVTGVSFGSRTNKTTWKIHQLVAETFKPNPNNYPIPNHKDGNKLNNFVENLEWCTYKYNTKHAIENGLMIPINEFAFSLKCRKLSDNDVLYILDHYIPRHNKYGSRALARKYNVTHSIITDIIHKKTYKNVS
jgi:hypothetical protein